MFCPKCGKRLHDNAKFCTECGYQIKTAPPEAMVHSETPVPPNSPPVQILASEAATDGNVKSVSRTKKKTLFIFFLAIAAVIILAFVGVKMFFSEKDPMENDSGASRSAGNKSQLPIDAVNDDVERAKAYLNVIFALQKKHGQGFYTDEGEPSGLVIVREIDFDKNGTPELLCAFSSTPSGEIEGWTLEAPYCDGTNCLMCYEVWGWQDGQSKRLVHAPLLGSKAVDDFVITLKEQDGKIYILQADGYVTAGVSIASTVQNGQWVEVAHLYCNNFIGEPFDSEGNFITSNFAYYNQAEEISAEEYDAILEQWFHYEDDEVEVIPMWYGNAQFQQTCLTIQRLNGMITQDASTANADNQLESASDNQPKSASIDAAQIDISNYVGEWVSEEFPFESISIYMKDGVAHVICRASYRDGAILVSTESAQLTFSGNTATAEAKDSWGNTSSIYLEFEEDTFYATVQTRGTDLNWSISMGREHFIRLEDVPPEEEPDIESDYWFDSKYIDEDSLSDVTRDDIMWARNEIYARHGYIFQNKDIQAAFEATDWYVPNPNYSDSLLNDIEKENLDTIISYEKKMGWRS